MTITQLDESFAFLNDKKSLVLVPRLFRLTECLKNDIQEIKNKNTEETRPLGIQMYREKRVYAILAYKLKKRKGVSNAALQLTLL